MTTSLHATDLDFLRLLLLAADGDVIRALVSSLCSLAEGTATVAAVSSAVAAATLERVDRRRLEPEHYTSQLLKQLAHSYSVPVHDG